MQAIVAVSENWGIGKDNELLFRISADLKRFKALTSGQTVLMGRKTLESLPGGKGLPKRRNVVLTSDPHYTAENAECVNTPAGAVFAAGADAFTQKHREFIGTHFLDTTPYGNLDAFIQNIIYHTGIHCIHLQQKITDET
jgi:dihydrofolate reductase